MKRTHIRWLLLTLLSLAIVWNGLNGRVEGQITNLKVSAYPTTLKAGSNTSVVITILNSYVPIYDMDVVISFPQSQVTPVSPVVIGTSNLKFEKLNKGENVTLTPLIFVPEEAAGNGYQANIQIVYKRLGYISPSSEVHTVGFYVQGEIIMVIYDILIEPEMVTGGSTLTLTGNLLNKGNIPALYTNASLLPHPILLTKSESYSYIGEVEPNSPLPFTLEATVSSAAEEGLYTVKIRMDYEDQEAQVYHVEETIQFSIVEVEESPPPSSTERVIELLRAELLFFAVIVVLVIIVIGLIVRIRQLSRSEFEGEFSA